MKLCDFVVPAAIVPDLQATTKEAAIRAMVSSLCQSGVVPASDEEGIVSAILKREELGSTGIGRGVAVPHTKHPSVDRLIARTAVERYLQCIKRLKSFRGPIHPSPLFGPMTYDELVAIQLIHAAHHLRFLEPEESTARPPDVN